MSIEGQEHQIDPAALRAELKVWENGFREQNGRKAGREDIKKDAALSAKYKLYNELTKAPKRPQVANSPRKITRPAPSKHSPSRRTSHATSTTPRKTPTRSRVALLQPPNLLSPVHEAEPEPEPTPQWIRAALGPTPQRDGHVLGLFEVDDDVQETPLKNGQGGVGASTVAGTPSKGTSSAEHIHMKSPQSSSGKHFLFAAFAGTPIKRKRDNNDLGTTSSSKRKYATPSFLRRCNPLAKIDEDEAILEPVNRPLFQKRGMVRSLSSIIQNLKKQQDKEMDDEWDIMDEIEAEERGETVQKKKDVPEVQVEDSQVVEMPLGPDQASASSGEDSTPEHGQPMRKPWKKKGLKRQTRRTNMRPVLHKARKEGDDDPSASEDETEKVAETQLQAALTENVDEAPQSDDNHDDHDDNDVTANKPSKPSKPKLKEKTSSKGTADKNNNDDDDDDDAAAAKKKKPPRKVNAEAHANYRRLNIKNKNSKAKGRGRFGKR